MGEVKTLLLLWQCEWDLINWCRGLSEILGGPIRGIKWEQRFIRLGPEVRNFTVMGSRLWG